MNKKTLIILPGWGGSSETWKNFAELARNDFDVHIFDLPCFGTEPAPKDVWGVEEYANFVKQKIKNLNLEEQPILLGHSFGGQVATFLVGTDNSVCKKLILCGAAVIRNNNTAKNVIFGTLATAGKCIFSMPVLWRAKTYAEKILYKLADSPDYKKTSGTEREIFKKVIRQDMQHMLQHIKIPTLVLWGKHDTYTPLTQGRAIAKQLPYATFELIEDAKHGIHLQAPHELLMRIKNFAYNLE